MNHDNHHNHQAMVRDFRKRFWLSLLLSVPILLLSPLIQEFLGLEALAFSGQLAVSAFFSTVIFFYGGWPFLAGLKNELIDKTPGMMTLIGLAVSVAYLYSLAVVLGVEGEAFFWELATLIDVMLLGHWIEMRSVMGASKALDELAKLMPATAHKVTGQNQTEDVAIEELQKGDQVIVKPGEKFPVDGQIIEGSTTVNEAMITGESKPIAKGVDSQVVGGSLNQDGSVTVETQKTGEDSYLAQVMEMVQSAQASQSKTQNLANRAAFWLTIVAIVGGVGTFAIWVGLGNTFNFALTRMVTVMVITCPHALGLAIPLVVSRSTGLTAKNGLLIRDRNGFERARNIDTIILDKTGTLTKGDFAVSEALSFGEMSDDELLILAASVESRSEHPLAQPIVQKAAETKPVTNFQAIPGQGVEGKVEGRIVRAVGPNYLKANDIAIAKEKVKQLKEQGDTLVYILFNQKPMGVIALADQIRPQSQAAIDKLKAMGIKPVMLTGDSQAVAQSVATQLGIQEYFSGVLPDQKQDKITQLQQEGGRVAMVGDGVNDAPALAAADVGIAIGAGTDVAAETADIILVNSNPLDIVKTIEFARTTYGKMKQNLWWATGYNVFAIPLAAGVLYSLGILLSPAVGAALMSASTVVVAVNARLLEFG